MRSSQTTVFLLSILMMSIAHAMGLRSFVALPVEKGGAVGRMQLERNTDQDIERSTVNLAYGMRARHTLLFGLPYRLSPSGPDRLGDLSALYRYIAWQVDGPARTHRLGLLGGGIMPTENSRDGAIQGGAVATFYRQRYEWDLDLLYAAGLSDRPDAARYDVSWQYRLTPAEYPDWGIGAEWDLVAELGGRWRENQSTVHQITFGVQWISQRWVLEGGVIWDLNDPHHTSLLLSTRLHL